MAFQSACGDNRAILLETASAMASSADYQPPPDGRASDGWVRLFRARERILHGELTARLGVTGQDGSDFDQWNGRTETAQRFAEAHAARTTSEALHAGWCAGNHPPSHQPVLHDLYQLHCLEQAATHAGWYLAHGLLTASDVLGLPERTSDIWRRLVLHTDTVLEMLEIPEAILDAMYRSGTWSQASSGTDTD